MHVPEQFTPEYIDENSPRDEQLYSAFLHSGEPYASINKPDTHTSARLGYTHDPAAAPEDSPYPGLDLEDDNVYYNTAGAAAAYWAEHNLPEPSKELKQLRADLRDWGYCIIEDALSPEQLIRLKKRIDDQATAERRAGVANWTGTPVPPGQKLPRTQFVHSLINKGEQFIQCVEHDPAGVQAGPLIEQLLHETMGKGFLMSSFIAIITRGHNLPQGLHQDQATAPFQDAVAPYTVNTMYVMDDMGEENGGTLVVPGSHQLLSAPGSGNPVTEPLPPAINLEAKAGSVVIFEGRLLHGTGVNKTDKSRTIMVANSVKPFMRQQELHMLSARRDVLENASKKLLYRLGAFPVGLGGVEGAWSEHIVNQRLQLEDGEFEPIGELSPDSPLDELARPFSFRASELARGQLPLQPEVDPSIREKFADVPTKWRPEF